MARKKVYSNTKPRPKIKPVKRGSSGSFHFFTSKPFWQLVVFFVVIALLAIFRNELSAFFEDVRALLGWGLLLVLIAIIAIITVILRRNSRSFAVYWNRWLGAVAFAFAAWGILGIIGYNNSLLPNGLGGCFGYAFFGSLSPLAMGTFTGSLCILGYIIIGLFLVIPRPCFRLIKRFLTWIWSLINVQPASKRPGTETRQPGTRAIQHRPSYESKPPQPSYMEEPLEPPEVTRARKKLEELAEKAASLRPGTRPVEASTFPRQD